MELDSRKNEAKNDLQRMDIDIEVRRACLDCIQVGSRRMCGSAGSPEQVFGLPWRAADARGRSQMG